MESFPLQITTSEGTVHTVKFEDVSRSTLIFDMLEHNKTCHLPGINGATFISVLMWQTAEAEELKILTLPEIKRLIDAANYLDHKLLIETCSKSIALRIKGRDVEETREILGIREVCLADASDADKILKENGWVELK